MSTFDDMDGYDLDPPDELKAWREEMQRRSSEARSRGLRHWILVNSKLKPVSLLEWARWFEDSEARRIDYTDVSNEPNYPGGDSVSTVCLGLDHGFGDFEKPILFETMVFGGQYDQHGWRYATPLEAKTGHWHIVDRIRAGLPPEAPTGHRPWLESFMDMLEDEKQEDSQ